MAEMPAQVSNTEPNQAESRNGNVAADNSAPAAANDTSRLEAGGEMEAEDSAVPTVPDGGWGWMVVFGSFMIHVIADGIAYSFGVFVEDFVVYFQCSKSAVGGLGSLMVLVAGASGIVDLCVIITISVFFKKKLQLIHAVHGDGPKTAKIIKRHN